MNDLCLAGHPTLASMLPSGLCVRGNRANGPHPSNLVLCPRFTSGGFFLEAKRP
jgi:hypothetical protein